MHYTQDIKVSGVSAESILIAFLRGDRISAVSDCQGVNCQETCPEVPTGPDSYCSVKEDLQCKIR